PPHPDLTLHWRDDGALVANIGNGAALAQPATLWLVGFDKMHTMSITAGENEGKTAWDHHPVRSFRRLGSWGGGWEELTFAPGEAKTLGDYGAAVILQKNGTGRIPTAASTMLPAH